MLITDNFVFFAIKFILFILFFFFLGRGFLILIFKSRNVDLVKVSNLNIYIFYPVLGIILLGNYLFLLNFIVPLNSFYSFFIILFLLPNIYIFPNFKEVRKAFRNIFLYLVFLIPSYDLSYHYDSGLYHLNFQAFLRESNIIFGISNIYGPYGISSIYEYISAALWIDKSYVLLQFLNVIFVILFYEILFNLLFTSSSKYLNNAGFALLLYSLLDNIGLNGGRNGYLYFQGIGKQDTSLAILYFVTVLIIFLNLQKEKNSNLEIFLPTIFTLFVIQLKISGVTVLVFYIFYLIKLVTKNNLNTVHFLGIFSSLILGILWGVKSVLQTGCVIYPLEISCLDVLPWFNREYTKVSLESAQMFSIAYDFNSSLSVWFKQFLEYSINKTIMVNFTASVLIIAFLFFKHKDQSNFQNNKNLLFLVFFNLLFFSYYGPHFRYLMATQLIIIFLIGISKESRFRISSSIIYIAVVLSVISFVRLNSYRSFNFTSHPNHEIPVPELVTYNERYLPVDGDQCWAIMECSPNLQNYQVNDSGFYKIVTIKEEN